MTTRVLRDTETDDALGHINQEIFPNNLSRLELFTREAKTAHK